MKLDCTKDFSIKQFLFVAFWVGIFMGSSMLLYITLPAEGHRDIDSAEYETIAQHYVLTGNLSHPEFPHEMPSHTIGYHWFLGIIIYLMSNIHYVFLIQSLLIIVCGLLMYYLTLTIFDTTVALVTLALFYSSIGFAIYAQMLLSEILLSAFLISFIFCFCLFLHAKKIAYLILAGLTLGCSIIVKPVALFFIIIACGFIFFIDNTALYKKIFLSLMLLISFYVPVTSYMLYNKKTFGTFCVTNLINENLHLYFLPNRLLPLVDQTMRASSINALTACTSRAEKLQISKQIFFNILQNQPHIVCYAWFNAMVRTFLGLYSTQLKSMFNPTIQGGSCSFFNMTGNIIERIQKYICFGSISPYLTAICSIEACWRIMQYLLCIIAFIYLWTIKKYLLFFFFGSYIGYFSCITGHDGCGRYRLMFEPILIILSALALVILYQYIVRKQKVFASKEAYSLS
jgi:4-amino-4-deoxy-L-arabinose transferase-like glycosyltransferase